MREFFRFFSRNLIFVSSLFCLSLTAFAQGDSNSRGIVPVFESVRPPVVTVTGKPPNQPTKRPPYHRISQKINSGKIGQEDHPKRRPPQNNQADIQLAKSQQIGITLWKLLPASFRGGGSVLNDDEYIPQINGGRTNYLTPHRVSLETLFENGDYVRMAIEAAKRGYLYVIDQEMYVDGSIGDALLVFPNQRLRGGANQIAPGSPIEIPDLSNNPFYFELRPQSQNGKPIIAEILSIIITDRPIAGLKISDQPILISKPMLGSWRTKWAGRAEIFEPEGNTKSGYTKAEREAGGGKQKLTQNDPLPQTVFLIESNRNGGTLITVPLWYNKE